MGRSASILNREYHTLGYGGVDHRRRHTIALLGMVVTCGKRGARIAVRRVGPGSWHWWWCLVRGRDRRRIGMGMGAGRVGWEMAVVFCVGEDVVESGGAGGGGDDDQEVADPCLSKRVWAWDMVLGERELDWRRRAWASTLNILSIEESVVTGTYSLPRVIKFPWV